ncbi:MAG: hypothetical protein J6Z33_00230 [Lachnospiraceae bacterium]|nr:hypothetical protein [Lachnospiraceae bacterium]MBP5732289.1 hypothetical protein [Lachnospiraceae bacterium]
MEEFKEFESKLSDAEQEAECAAENDEEQPECEAKQETEAPEEKGKKFRCPCCGYYTLEEVGTYEVCPVCYWEDDPVQESDPKLEGGANELCLLESRRNFKLYGACEERYVKRVRAPLPEEMEDE